MRKNKTVWNNYRPNGIKSIVIALLIWVAVGVGIWFLIPKLSWFSLVAGGEDIELRIRVIRLIILEVTQLILMIWPMIEYLFAFHRVTTIRDKYKWYLPFAIMICVSFVAILIVNAATLTTGWITLIQMVGILAVICIPRFLFPPQ